MELGLGIMLEGSASLPRIKITTVTGMIGRTFGMKNGSAEKRNKNSSRKWKSRDSKSSPVQRKIEPPNVHTIWPTIVLIRYSL